MIAPPWPLGDRRRHPRSMPEGEQPALTRAALAERAATFYRRVAEETRGAAWVQRATRVLARISAQLYLGIGGAVALTFVASLVGWLAFDSVGDAQTEVNEASLPQLAGSFAVARQSTALAVAAPRLVAAASPEALTAMQRTIRTERQAFEILLTELTGHSGERFDRVRTEGGGLVTNLDALQRSTAQRFELRARRAALRAELAVLEADLARGPGALAVQLLTNAINAPDAATLASIRERFTRLVDGMAGNRSATGRLRDLGLAPRGVFELRGEWLALAARQQTLLTENARYAAGYSPPSRTSWPRHRTARRRRPPPPTPPSAPGARCSSSSTASRSSPRY